MYNLDKLKKKCDFLNDTWLFFSFSDKTVKKNNVISYSEFLKKKKSKEKL